MMLMGPEGQPFIKDFEKNVKLIAFGARIEKEGHARVLTRAFFNDDSPYGKRKLQAEPLQTTAVFLSCRMSVTSSQRWRASRARGQLRKPDCRGTIITSCPRPRPRS